MFQYKCLYEVPSVWKITNAKKSGIGTATFKKSGSRSTCVQRQDELSLGRLDVLRYFRYIPFLILQKPRQRQDFKEILSDLGPFAEYSSRKLKKSN